MAARGTTASAGSIAVDPRSGTADGGPCIPFHRRCIQVGKMIHGKRCGVMTVGAGITTVIAMIPGIVAVVLGRSSGMARGALGIDIQLSARPGRRCLTTMTADVAAGAAVEGRHPAPGIKGCGQSDVGTAVGVVMVQCPATCAVVTG